MYLILTLFFISLLSITSMLGYKVSLARNGSLQMRDGVHLAFPDLHKIKKLTRRGLRRYGFIALVIVIKIYVKISLFAKQKFESAKSSIIKILRKNKKFNLEDSFEKREVSGFLKMVSEYKHKVKSIKHKIIEEELGN